MSVIKSPVALFNVERQTGEAAELWNAITEQQLADWEALWQPATHEAIRRLYREKVPLERWPQSRHWDWRRKAASIHGLLANPTFSVMCDSVTQGLMILETTRRR